MHHFRDWISKEANFERATAEAALAHTVKDKTGAGYRGGNQLYKRRALMAAWGGYFAGDGDSVLRLVG